MIFNRLIVTNIRSNFSKKTFQISDEQAPKNSALNHQLKQTNGFQSDGFSTSIWSRNTQKFGCVPSMSKFADRFPFFFFISQQKQRVKSIYQSHRFMTIDFWQNSAHFFCKFGFCSRNI